MRAPCRLAVAGRNGETTNHTGCTVGATAMRDAPVICIAVRDVTGDRLVTITLDREGAQNLASAITSALEAV
jgi:hypothetical protein